ncbi:MAG: hypothetical protein KAU28_09575 [Phycisphaerae bacterium]|nr:hypothetical protein [Phycisphaerae bacterium]
MAKAWDISPIERHVEKGVLGVVLLLLLYAVVHWGISSPRKFADKLPPDEIDEALKKQAIEVKAWNDRAKAKPEKLIDYLKALRRCQRADVINGLGEVVELTPPRQKIDVEIRIEQPEGIKLAEMTELTPAPGKCKVQAERELPRTEPPTDVLVSHVVSVYPWGEMEAKWSSKLQQTTVHVRLVVLDVEAQVREKLPDGTWSAPRAVAAVSLPLLDGEGNPLARPEPLLYDGTNAVEVRESINALADLAWQKHILQPSYWDIYLPTGQWVSWRIHLPTNEVSEKATPEKSPSLLTTRQPEEYLEGMYSPDTASHYGKTATAATESPEVVPVPSLKEQMRAGKVLIWFHDQSLKSSKEYQYRVCLVLLNPLYTYDNEMHKDEKGGARVLALRTPYSEWSKPIVMPKATDFFLTGADAVGAKAYVTIFASSLGQRVSHRFGVSRGEGIGGAVWVEVTNPVTGLREQRQVDFMTGAVVVDFDFEKKFLKGNFYRQTFEMLYVDQQGKLKTRTGALDEESASFSKLLDEVERAKRASPDQ